MMKNGNPSVLEDRTVKDGRVSSTPKRDSHHSEFSQMLFCRIVELETFQIKLEIWILTLHLLCWEKTSTGWMQGPLLPGKELSAPSALLGQEGWGNKVPKQLRERWLGESDEGRPYLRMKSVCDCWSGPRLDAGTQTSRTRIQSFFEIWGSCKMGIIMSICQIALRRNQVRGL